MIDFSKVPGIVTIENIGKEDVKILSRPGSNQGFSLPAGESISLLAEHSYELISFYAQGALNADLKVTLPTSKVGE